MGPRRERRIKKVFSIGVRRECVSVGEGEDGGHFVVFMQRRELCKLGRVENWDHKVWKTMWTGESNKNENESACSLLYTYLGYRQKSRSSMGRRTNPASFLSPSDRDEQRVTSHVGGIRDVSIADV